MKRFAVGVPALLASICGLVMAVLISTDGFAPYPLASRFNHDIGTPVLALELAHQADDIGRVLPLPGDITPDECQDFCVNFPKTSGQRNCASGCGQDLSAACRRAVFINTLLDFVFIPLYVWFLLTFVVSVIPRGKLRVIAILFALSAGICDVIEDIFILLAVNSRPVPIFIPSLAKWAMIGLTVAVIGRCLIRDHDIIYSIATDRLLGLAYLASGLLLLFGVAAGEWFGYSWIQHGAAIFAAAFLISGIYVVAYCVRRWLPGQLVRYIDNFCEKRESGEPVDVAVRAEPQ